MALQGIELKRFEYAGGPAPDRYRAKLINAIENSGFSIEYLYETERSRDRESGETFGVFIKPDRRAKARYGIDREVLVWCSTYPTFSARDTNKIRSVREEYGTRLSSMFTVLVSRYARADRSALEVESGESQTIVHLTFDDLDSKELTQLLDSRLFSRDPFDLAGAVVRSADFFGRRDQIDSIVAEIESGTSQLGIFGLRKSGKTSLLNRLHDKLQNSARVYVARMDLQWTVSINGSPEYSAWALGESIFASHRDIRKIGEFRLLGAYDTFGDISDRELIWEWLANDLSRIANQARRPVCLLIDEIERMLEGSSAGFLRFWRVLRGLDQQTPGRLRIVVGGTSPQCAEMGYIDGKDNPMFNYLRVHYLGPLSSKDSSDMLTSLGRLAGMEFDAEVLASAYRSTGGHPALIRSLGSAMHSVRDSDEGLVEIGRDDIRDASDLVQQNSGSLIDQMLTSLAAQYPDESNLLEDLAKGHLYAFKQFAVEFPKEYRRLVNYGLVTAGDPPTVRIGLLQARIQKLANREPRAIKDFRYNVGDRIEDWEVLEPISHGGFSEVYRVINGIGEERALKAFTSSNAARVAREVEVLREFKHPNIVRFYHVVASEDGHPCLIMELLKGRSLSDYCNADYRPSFSEWQSWLTQTLDALAALHPSSIGPPNSEMNYEDFLNWNQSKFGYVHRDIKPENIIVTKARGPVLFDFNISSKVGDPVLTVSATPGYSPPTGVRWDAGADLYALGISFAEAGAGVRVMDTALEDLKVALRAAQGPKALSVVEYLLGCSGKALTTKSILSNVKKLLAGVAVSESC
ncbi:serine/threonine-protein kinase [Brachybacterium phenoliresistens]|uniref:serine/threonine-protein kinase n=1 Tax=Brachybacterium phenoliresistens TaxID=396014 RepID=UPI0004B2163B|nr:serine/threonine-protein kinase [Brachybacterium phenoliresistens]